MLAEVVGVNWSKAPWVSVFGQHHQMAPVYPELYAHPCGIFLDELTSTITGRIWQLRQVFNDRPLATMLPEKNRLVLMLCKILV
jgi:hypothetical protein